MKPKHSLYTQSTISSSALTKGALFNGKMLLLCFAEFFVHIICFTVYMHRHTVIN